MVIGFDEVSVVGQNEILGRVYRGVGQGRFARTAVIDLVLDCRIDVKALSNSRVVMAVGVCARSDRLDLERFEHA